MPANLGTLAPELLYKITEFFFVLDDKPVPQLYLRLAQVNRHFHNVFMSDHLWADLDVHGVKKEISRHYLEKKAEMGSKELDFCGGFDYTTWRHPKTEIMQFYQFSLYTQANVLAESDVFDKEGKSYLYDKIGMTDLAFHAARTWSGLKCASKSLKEDPEFMFRVANKGCATVYYASDALQDDKDFLLKCVSTDTTAIRYCSERLRNDKQVVIASLSNSGRFFDFVSSELRDDREVALAAITWDPLNLKFCSERLQNDREVVTKAVESDGVALEFASSRLRNDTSIVLAAVNSNWRAFDFAGKECKRTVVQLGAAKLVEVLKAT